LPKLLCFFSKKVVKCMPSVAKVFFKVLACILTLF
jgi:hypothetical protein